MFYDVSKFDFLWPLKDAWLEIRQEYDDLISVPSYPHGSNGFWRMAPMRYYDEVYPPRKACPKTTKLCDAVPGVFAYAFSVIDPGCIIYPHVGYSGAVVRSHLGLYVNPEADCYMKVGEEQRKWAEGEFLAFDDTSLHSSWNNGTTSRVVLILDFDKIEINEPRHEYDTVQPHRDVLREFYEWEKLET